SAKQNRYYYGVSGSEAQRSGLNRYRPSDSWSPYMQLTLDYGMTPALHAYFSGRYARLGRDITDSPMVDQTYTGSMVAGINYHF
ncbi:MAG: MipA/OmpV family protein, partial [Enterobacteriaceae bacterium]